MLHRMGIGREALSSLSNPPLSLRPALCERESGRCGGAEPSGARGKDARDRDLHAEER